MDKKPLGIKNELKTAPYILKQHRPHARTVLVLRDILDNPETTTQNWRSKGYYDVVHRFYDRVAVLGSPEIFDLPSEYQFPRTSRNERSFADTSAASAAAAIPLR